MNARYVGLKFAKLWSCVRPPHRHRANLARGTATGPLNGSRHAGLRALRRTRSPIARASCCGAPRRGQTWCRWRRSTRSISRRRGSCRRSSAQWSPAIVHAHDPHAVSMAALALSFGAPITAPEVDRLAPRRFHLQSHAFSQWKDRQMDGFIAASARDQGDPRARWHSWAASTGCMTASMSTRSHYRVTTVARGVLVPHGVPVMVNVGVLVGHKGQKHCRRHAAGAAGSAGRASDYLRRRGPAPRRCRSRSSS